MASRVGDSKSRSGSRFLVFNMAGSSYDLWQQEDSSGAWNGATVLLKQITHQSFFFFFFLFPFVSCQQLAKLHTVKNKLKDEGK